VHAKVIAEFDTIAKDMKRFCRMYFGKTIGKRWWIFNGIADY